MHKFLKLSLIPALLTLSSGYASADIWTINATFDSSDFPGVVTVAGTADIAWSGGVPDLVSYNVQTTGEAALFVNDFTNLNSFATTNGFGADHFFVYDPGTAQYFLLFWSPDLSKGSSSAAINFGLLCDNGPCTVLTSGTITSVATPEPASAEVLGAEGATLGLGFALFALLRRRRFLNS